MYYGGYMEQCKVSTSVTFSWALKWSQIFEYIQNPVNQNISEVTLHYLPFIQVPKVIPSQNSHPSPGSAESHIELTEEGTRQDT